MKLKARVFSCLLALTLGLSGLCAPASAAKYSNLTFTDKAGNQVTYLDQQYQDIAELPIGTQIILTGRPDYNAADSDGAYNYVGFNTDKGTWYIRLGSYSVDALKEIVPDDGSITEFTACGTYVGLPYVEFTPTGRTVWIPTHGGTKYHSHSGCSNMIDPQKVDLGYAEARGYGACKRCY